MAVKLQEIFARDPKAEGLANDGQARIRNERTEQAERELRSELCSFVSDGQYGRAMERVLSGYLKHLTRDRQLAAWISGFYGSGKSHLLKMLGHLWQNTTFADGSTARGLVVGLPSEVAAALQELDQSAKRAGVGRFAAMGQLPAGSGEFVRATIASIVLEARGLPAQVQLAEFVFWLREQGIDTQVRAAIEAAGKNWLSELESIYVSPLLANAVLKAMPSFAATEADARRAFAAQFPKLKQDVDTNRFVNVIRLALEEDAKLPFSVIVLDEVQQYIGDSPQRAADVTEAIEALYTRLDCRVLVIGAGQSALSANTPTLLRLRDRFLVTIELSDTDVEAVTRKVVLSKKPTFVPAVQEMLDRHDGEISRQLRSAPRLAAKSDDARFIVIDYPLLPTRRRFWEECFRAVDAQGSHSQLRSQLKVLHSCVAECAERGLGYVIPGDALYARIADKLVNTGVLLNELFTRIEKLKDGTPDGDLRHRICGVVFLITKLPREQGVDLGVRATAEVIADLLIDDLTVPSGPFRTRVAETLEQLATDSTLMKVGDEYRLQTTEGAEWDRAFRERVTGLNAQADEVEAIRSRKFREEAQRAVAEVRLKHGVSKTPRSVALHYDVSSPSVGDSVTIWVRDGWSTSEKEVLGIARSMGVDDPTIHVFIPKKEADALKRVLTDAEAAQRVLDNKGTATGREGEEARASILSRKSAADAAAHEALLDIFRGARVFQGGGNEVTLSSLTEALISAANASVARLFPSFSDADLQEWPLVIKRAREGNDNPFSPVGFSGPVQDHVVAKEVLRVMGNGETGSKIRRALEAPPYGWPKDAIDAALIALHRAGVVRAARNGSAIAPGALDQNNIPTAEFRPEATIVSTKDRIAVKGVCAHLGVSNVRSGEEELRAGEALRALADLGKRAGGEAPLPAPPSMTLVNELTAKSGGELLVAVAGREKEIKELWNGWKKQAELVGVRQPAWDRAVRLAACGKALPELADARAQLAAIALSRGLLAEPDPVAPVAGVMAGVLRGRLQAIQEGHERAVTEALALLDSNDSWKALTPEQRTTIVEAQKIAIPMKPAVGTDEELRAALETSSLEARENVVALVASRVAVALSDAVRLVKPASHRVRLAPVTLETAAEVEAWVREREAELLEEIKKGPVILG
jgi:hypothetical protein